MKTDVWMPLYWGDLLADTLHLNRADFGSYLLLIGAYWRKQGPLPDDDAYLANVARCTLSEWTATRSALAQHFQIEGGAWRHKRVEHELGESKRLKEARKRGADEVNRRKKAQSTPLSDTLSAPLSATQSGVPSPSPLAVERAVGVEATRPSWEEVKIYADRIGLAEWKARDWLDEMLAVGWKDWNHRPVLNWQPMLTRVCRKWEADGRPSAPPAAPQPKSNGNPKNSGAGSRNCNTTNERQTDSFSAANARKLAAERVSNQGAPATGTHG